MSNLILQNTKLELWSKEHTGPKFHAVLCDPPYGLKFMGKDWDVVSAKEWGEALLPHLYPGALCLMFGGTRTWHKLATGMEEAGFEMWETLMWLYGQGFPKGQDISKLIDKKNGDSREIIGTKDPRSNIDGRKRQSSAINNNWRAAEDRTDVVDLSQQIVSVPGSEQSAPWSGHKTPALKPAWEPILAFRVPAKQTYAELALEHGSGCLNIDAARIGTSKDIPATPSRHEDIRCHGKFGPEDGTADGFNPNIGRYPANLLLDEESATLLDEQTGRLNSGKVNGKYVGNIESSPALGDKRAMINPETVHGDSGGASRFFYCAKAGTAERNAGCEALEAKAAGLHDDDNYRQPGERKANHTAPLPRKNHHPTVKPLALTEYLAKLLLPPDSVKPRRLLVPFAGSGSEMIGAFKAGWDEVVGIEQSAEYCEIANCRIEYWKKKDTNPFLELLMSEQ